MSEPKPIIDKPSPTDSLVRALLAWLARLLVVLTLWVAFTYLVAMQIRYWEQFSLKLPVVTELLVTVHKLSVIYWPVCLLLPLADLILTLLIAVQFPRHTWLLSVWSYAFLLAVMFFVLWYILASVLPLLSLLNILA